MNLLPAALLSILLGAIALFTGRRFQKAASGRRLAWLGLLIAANLFVGVSGLVGLVAGAQEETDLGPLVLATVSAEVAVATWGWGSGAWRFRMSDLVPLHARVTVPLGVGIGLLWPVVSVLWAAFLAAAGGAGGPQSVATAFGDLDGWEQVAMGAFLVGVAPVVEECLFRGYLLGAIRGALGTRLAIVASGLAFGAMHLNDPWTVPVLAAFGMALGWLRVRTGTLWASIAAHAANNAVGVALALAVG